MEPKSLQNRFRSGFGRALNEDSVSKLKKERAESIGGVAEGYKLDGIWALGRGNKEGGSIVLTRLTTCPRTGVGGSTYRVRKKVANQMCEGTFVLVC